MVINNFSSYFEILAGVNFGFSAFNFFKDKLELYIESISIMHKEYNDLNDLIIAKTAESNNENARIFRRTVADTKKTLIEEGKSEQKFMNHLKPLSLMLGLYCTFLLVVGGFQGEKDNFDFSLLIESNANDIIVILGSLIVIFSYLVFCGSFMIRLVINNIRINLIGIIFIFFAFVFASLLIKYNIFNSGVITLLIIIIPVILYIIFIGVLRLNCKSFDNVKEDYKSEIYNEQELKKEKRNNNFWFWFLSVLGLFVLITPICCYFSTQKEESKDMVVYFITLTLPISLYIFLLLRTLRHQYKFNKLFDKFHSTYFNQFKGAIKVMR